MMMLLSKQEAERLLAYCFSLAVPYSFGVMSDGKPAFMLKNPLDLVINGDRSVTWRANELGVGLHIFILLTTGEQTRRTVYIPLCLVTAKTRNFLKRLINTTVDPADGRFNSRPAEFYVLTPDGYGTLIKTKLELLATQYVTLQLIPPDFASRYASPHCPFCRAE